MTRAGKPNSKAWQIPKPSPHSTESLNPKPFGTSLLPQKLLPAAQNELAKTVKVLGAQDGVGLEGPAAGLPLEDS